MKTKHTPAPWNADGIFVCDEEDDIVCEMSTCTNRAIADAHLIAAAPELLEALETLERLAGSAMMEDDPARVSARSAIRRAIGEDE